MRSIMTVLRYSLILITLFTSGMVNAALIHHDLATSVDPATHTITVKDTVTMPAEHVRDTFYCLLHGNLAITGHSENTKVTTQEKLPAPEVFGLTEPFELPGSIPVTCYRIDVTDPVETDLVLTLEFSGIIHHKIEEMSEEYERSFSTSPGIISEDGVVLSGSALWMPWFRDTLVSFTLTSSVPADWDTVSQGTRTRHEIIDNRRITTWDSPEPQDDVYLIAAAFTEYHRTLDKVDIYAFLRTPDPQMAEKYLETTAQYMDTYVRLIGEFPYTKFALVENFWETGYGMPSFTLLGPQIIRFPFILHSSYPHELLHNWWGNSVFVDYDGGNWCEGTTVYMADHMIKEQRNAGVEYRRTTLEKYTSFVHESNEFPLSEFISRHDAASESIGYGKSMMLFHMLRQMVGDELFIKSFQRFYRDNIFKSAGFSDIQSAFETETGLDLEWIFAQWIQRKGAPALTLTDTAITRKDSGYDLTIGLSQIQEGPVFRVQIPLYITVENQAEIFRQTVEMTEKNQSFTVHCPDNPLGIEIDPEYDLFRLLHAEEIPPSLSRVFGSEKILIILPTEDEPEMLVEYRKLAEKWADTETRSFTVKTDTEVDGIPEDHAVWLFGWNNRFLEPVQKSLDTFGARISPKGVIFKQSMTVSRKNNSIITAAAHPGNTSSAIAWLATDNPAAMDGLSRKLPHYGRYGYLAFEGDEPSNFIKGQWVSETSPLKRRFGSNEFSAKRADREPLIQPAPVFSADRMMDTIRFLSSESMEGRVPGSSGIDLAAESIAGFYNKMGLEPASDDGTWFQSWTEVTGPDNREITLKNVMGRLPGKTVPEETVVVCAHYDHLGLGWPETAITAGNKGKRHPGADDNASGIAVMLEVARIMVDTGGSDRSILFIAFTGEENGRMGSQYFVENYKVASIKKIIGAVNLDTVGRLAPDRKVLILGSNSAREWKHIFMGIGFVTGVESEMVTEDLDTSDQVSFTEKGIPGIQVFGGPHLDYHKPTDTPDKILPGSLIRMATLTRETVTYLAGKDATLTPATKNSGKPASTHAGGTARKVSTGLMPDFAHSGPGVKIQGVAPDSPAMTAGLKTGDVITHIDGTEIEGLRHYSGILKSHAPGDNLVFTIARDSETLTVPITLTSR